MLKDLDPVLNIGDELGRGVFWELCFLVLNMEVLSVLKENGV